MAENIGRKTFRGIGLKDEEDALGALIREYREAVDFDEESEISLASFSDENAGEVLKEQKFSAKEQESRDLYVRVSDISSLGIAGRKAPSYVEKLGMISARDFKQGITGP